MKRVYFIVLPILILDQLVKIWVKTNFELGESYTVFSDWFRIYFVENPGMAYGKSFGGEIGKIILTIVRIVLIGFIFYFIKSSLKRTRANHFLVPMSFILAGAIGNVIDSVFYGLIFDTGTTWGVGNWVGYSGISEFTSTGYASLFQGSVVDMLSFSLFSFNWPNWVPIVGGEYFEFFKPIFNIADASITIGAVILILFNKKAFS